MGRSGWEFLLDESISEIESMALAPGLGLGLGTFTHGHG